MPRKSSRRGSPSTPGNPPRTPGKQPARPSTPQSRPRKRRPSRPRQFRPRLAQRRKAWTRRHIAAAGCATVSVFFTLLLVTLLGVPFLLGGSALAVGSGSMTPAIRRGDMVITRSVNPVQACTSIRIGQVVTYDAPNIGLVTHRVVGVVPGNFGDGTICRFTTKGDANTTADAPVSPAQVRGKVVFHLPWLGWLWKGLGTFGTVALLVVLLVAAALCARRLSRRPHNGTHRHAAGPGGADAEEPPDWGDTLVIRPATAQPETAQPVATQPAAAHPAHSAAVGSNHSTAEADTAVLRSPEPSTVQPSATPAGGVQAGATQPSVAPAGGVQAGGHEQPTQVLPSTGTGTRAASARDVPDDAPAPARQEHPGALSRDPATPKQTLDSTQHELEQALASTQRELEQRKQLQAQWHSALAATRRQAREREAAEFAAERDAIRAQQQQAQLNAATQSPEQARAEREQLIARIASLQQRVSAAAARDKAIQDLLARSGQQTPPAT